MYLQTSDMIPEIDTFTFFRYLGYSRYFLVMGFGVSGYLRLLCSFAIWSLKSQPPQTK